MVLTGREKATIFLSILGAETSSKILRYLPEEIADIIAAGINHLPTPSPEALSAVIEEFQGYLALPEAKKETYLPPQPPAPKKSFAVLIYERPQVASFVLSILPQEERGEALYSLNKDKPLIEELLNNLKINNLRAKLEDQMKENFAGKIF